MERPAWFAEDLMSDWALYVLDHDLPQLPRQLDAGEAVPVARWAGPGFGAVLNVDWGDDDEEGPFLDSEILLFRRTADGWEEAHGSGGTNWFDPPFQRPVLPPRFAALTGETCAGGEGWFCSALDGVAGVEAVAVEVETFEGVITRRPLESPIGVFIVAVDATSPATVRVLDAADAVLATEQFGGHAIAGI